MNEMTKWTNDRMNRMTAQESVIYVGQAGQGVARTGVLWRIPLLPGRMLCCCCSDRSPLSWTFCLSRSIAWAVRGPAWVSTWLYNWLALAVCSCCWSFTIWLKGIIIQYAHTESMRIQILINFLFICLNTVLYFSSNESAARFSTLL